MNHESFKIGFWHPLGPHGRETVGQILDRKRKEIEVNGWTLWSFQYRRLQVLEEWCRHLATFGGSPPVVFCSRSPGATDPAEVEGPVKTADCQAFRFATETEWQTMPLGIRVPHPFRVNRRQASAFVVQGIVHPIELSTLPHVEWLSNGKWQQNRVPTRGEYLIRPGRTTPMRQISAVLQLRAPYLAVVNADVIGHRIESSQAAQPM